MSSVRRAIKELRSAVGRECRRLEAALAIYPRTTPIIDTVNENQVSVAFGEIGVGKSTQMTQYLYEAGFAKNGLIVWTRPRKVVATSLAAHVAEEMGGAVRHVVGCHVGRNVPASKATGIIYAIFPLSSMNV